MEHDPLSIPFWNRADGLFEQLFPPLLRQSCDAWIGSLREPGRALVLPVILRIDSTLAECRDDAALIAWLHTRATPRLAAGLYMAMLMAQARILTKGTGSDAYQRLREEMGKEPTMLSFARAAMKAGWRGDLKPRESAE